MSEEEKELVKKIDEVLSRPNIGQRQEGLDILRRVKKQLELK